VTATGSAAPSMPSVNSASATLPTWHRALDIFTGVLAIVLAIVALSDPAAGAALLIFLFAFALLFLGAWRLTRAMAHTSPPGWHRTVDALFGVLGIAIAFVVLLFPGLGLLSLVFLLYFGLVFIGIGWIIFGARRVSDPGWYRGFAVALGVFSLVAALVAILDVGVAILSLIFLLAFVLLLIGVGELISGATGRAFSALPVRLLPPNMGTP
jgi:uncharacterized membrane protein HdeD (DUF308 family)